MSHFDSFFDKYDRLVFFDTETTGLAYSRDEIIEFSAVVVERQNGQAVVTITPTASVWSIDIAYRKFPNNKLTYIGIIDKAIGTTEAIIL